MSEPAENDFKFICKLSDLKENAGQRFIIEETEIAVFKVDDKIYALSNICPHQHTALIYDGYLEDGCIVCPVHGWKFDLQTGKKTSGRRGLDSYKVNVMKDDVFVKVVPPKFKW